jgi:hypothetical protein
MFGENHDDSIVQRGIDEALACQDMLARVPVKPSLLTRVVARLVPLGNALIRRTPAPRERQPPAVRHSTVTR